MMAAVIQSPGKVELQQVTVPKPDAGQVLVRLEGCGVCASNLPPWLGRPWFNYPMQPGQLGHEGWGTIVSLGSSADALAVGQRVAMLSDHAYAQYDVADHEKVVPLPRQLDHMPVPGEPLGCAMTIFDRCGIQAGQTVAVIGVGFLGALMVRLASMHGARVIAVARREFSLDLARQMGAAEVVPMLDHATIIERVKDLTGGRFCDVTIEAAGYQWPLDLAGELTGVRGRLVVAGYHQDGPRQVNMQLWNWRGLDVINAHERQVEVSVAGIRKAVALLQQGKLDVTPLLTHVFPLSSLGEALSLAAQHSDGFVKALVMMKDQ
ncbi:MAG: zinc-binding dehydrogenase [Planctomycetaceae bacterium]